MRAWLAALVFLMLAGCTQPGDAPETDPLFGLCPQWSQGPGGQTTALRLDGEAPIQRRELGPAEATWDGDAFDMYRVRLDHLNLSGRVELRAYDANDRQLGLRDFRGDTPRIEPMIVVAANDQGQEFEIYLSSVKHGSMPAPAPASLGWTLEGDSAEVAYSVTFHYKVCGADP